MRALTLLCLTAVACTGSRRPVAKKLAVVQEVTDQEVAPRQGTSSGPWHQRQSRWGGTAHTAAPSVKWSIPTNGPVVHPLRTDGTRVYVVAGGEVTALTVGGVLIWKVAIGASGPVGFGDAGLFVPTKTGVMQVLNKEDGQINESHGGTLPIMSAPLPLGPSMGWLDRAGTLITTSGPNERYIQGPISDAATLEDTLVVGNAAGEVVAATTTSTKWRATVPGPVIGHPVLDAERAYIPFGARDGRRGGVSAVDLHTGAVIWETRLRSEPSASPALGEHLIVPDKKSELIALDRRHGGIRWRSPASSTFVGQPAVQADAIYAGRHDGRLDRIDMSDGGTVWSLDLGDALTGEMCHASGTIFLGTADGRVVALGAE